MTKVNYLGKGVEAKIINAKFNLSNLNLKSKAIGDTLITVKDVNINGFNLDWPKQSVFIDSFQITGANIYSKLEKDGQINLIKAFEKNQILKV